MHSKAAELERVDPERVDPERVDCESNGVARANEPVDLEAYVRELPYEPSVPCAACARGVDPLRAARVSATDDGLMFFCSPSCLTSYRAAERRLATKSDAAARSTSRALSTSRLPTDSIARR